MQHTFCGNYNTAAMTAAGVVFTQNTGSVILEGDYETCAAQIKPYELPQRSALKKLIDVLIAKSLLTSSDVQAVNL